MGDSAEPILRLRCARRALCRVVGHWVSWGATSAQHARGSPNRKQRVAAPYPLHEPAERRDANAVRGEGPLAGRAARPSRQWLSWYPRSVLRISGWPARHPDVARQLLDWLDHQSSVCAGPPWRSCGSLRDDS